MGLPPRPRGGGGVVINVTNFRGFTVTSDAVSGFSRAERAVSAPKPPPRPKKQRGAMRRAGPGCVRFPAGWSRANPRRAVKSTNGFTLSGGKLGVSARKAGENQGFSQVFGVCLGAGTRSGKAFEERGCPLLRLSTRPLVHWPGRLATGVASRLATPGVRASGGGRPRDACENRVSGSRETPEIRKKALRAPFFAA